MPRETSRYGWYVVSVLLGVYMVHHLDRMVVTLLLDPIGREFQLSDSQLGLLAGLAYAIPFALAGIPLGMLVDRVNRVRLLTVLVTVWSGLTAMAAFATGFWTLLLARVGVAAAESGATPTNVSIISDQLPATRRATALGVYYMGPSLGTIVGFSVAGAVATSYGWRAGFLVAGLPGLLLALLLWRTVREPPRSSRPGRPDGGRSPACTRAPDSLVDQACTARDRGLDDHGHVRHRTHDMVACAHDPQPRRGSRNRRRDHGFRDFPAGYGCLAHRRPHR